MKTQGQNNNIGDIMFELSQIEKMKNTDSKGGLEKETLTNNMGGFLTLICC